MAPSTDLGSRHRLLLRVERFSRQRYKLVFLVALLAVIAASWLGSKIKIESDLLKLIPVGNVQVDTLKEALQDFGSIDYLLVLMEATGEANLSESNNTCYRTRYQVPGNLNLNLYFRRTFVLTFVQHRHISHTA